jgi:transketolase
VKASEIIKATGKAIRVIDVFTVKPIDRETILKSANATNNRVLVVEDHYVEGGLGEAVMAALADQTAIKIHHLAIREVARSGKPAELLSKYGIDAQSIVNAVDKLIQQ